MKKSIYLGVHHKAFHILGLTHVFDYPPEHPWVQIAGPVEVEFDVPQMSEIERLIETANVDAKLAKLAALNAEIAAIKGV